jgi:hypothetical protein
MASETSLGTKSMSFRSGLRFPAPVVSNEEGLNEAQHKPDCQEGDAFKRKTFELEEKLCDCERNQERNCLSLHCEPKTKVLDQ